MSSCQKCNDTGKYETEKLIPVVSNGITFEIRKKVIDECLCKYKQINELKYKQINEYNSLKNKYYRISIPHGTFTETRCVDKGVLLKEYMIQIANALQLDIEKVYFSWYRDELTYSYIIQGCPENQTSNIIKGNHLSFLEATLRNLQYV